MSCLWYLVIGRGEQLKAVSGEDIRKKIFSERTVEHWNKPPREVVMTQSLSVFKKHLDNTFRYMA